MLTPVSEMDSRDHNVLCVPQEWNVLYRSRTGVEIMNEEDQSAGTDEGPKRRFQNKNKKGTVALGDTQRKRKKPRTILGEGSNNSKQMPISSTQDVCSSILQALNKTSAGCKDALDVHINLDHVLSRVPYKQMVQDLFGGTHDMTTPKVPIITRVYEEQYMREPINSTERMCVMGDECECQLIDKGNPFTGVELLLPGEEETDEKHMCVLCHRRFVQSMFHDIVYSGAEFRGVIQRYGNICGQPGEYAKEVALICPPNGPTQCIPFPSVSHQRNKYTIKTVGGVRYVIQNNMSPEDF